jgi:hypothetical protein
MNKVIKKEWVERLRSGKYKQGKYRLRDSNNNYCCLGVLCEVYVDEKLIPEPILVDENGPYSYGKEGNTSLLPLEVRLSSFWASELMCMNDKLDRTFPEIADYIEQNL